eukprot:202287-Hanusia_phi.AAC.2
MRSESDAGEVRRARRGQVHEHAAGSSARDLTGRAELLSPRKKQAETWVTSSAFGSGCVIGLCVDTRNGKLWFYRDDVRLVDMQASEKIPLDSGEHFFELSISIPGQNKGACLQVTAGFMSSLYDEMR